ADFTDDGVTKGFFGEEAFFKGDHSTANTIVHELGHAIYADIDGFSRSKWVKTAFELTLKDGYVPKGWLPTPYSRASPEEGFAESLVCFLLETNMCNQVMMKRNNPEAYRFLDTLTRTGRVP